MDSSAGRGGPLAAGEASDSEMVLSSGGEQLSEVQREVYRAKEEAFAAARLATRRESPVKPPPMTTSQSSPITSKSSPTTAPPEVNCASSLITNGGSFVVLNQGKFKFLVAQSGTRPSLPPSRPPPQLSLLKSVRPAVAVAPASPDRKPTTEAQPAEKFVDSVDLTEDDFVKKKVARSSEANSLDKTYPSLVVTARPSLSNKMIPLAMANSERHILDNKIRRILQMSADIFTEHLLQQRLLRCEQFCCDHPDRRLKLGMYSESARFPHSGGYVWIADCCPGACTSVFRGSIFEIGPQPPAVILKLLYHWACQTSAGNILQWVKVDKNFLKMFFMYLRAVCIAAVDENFQQMGGVDKVIEVGVISLGTSSGVGAVREVKIDILGVMDYENRVLRLRALDHLNVTSPPASASAIYTKKFQRILEVLHKWVKPTSTVVADFVIDKAICAKFGFTKMVQSSEGRYTNAHVVDYLRFCVPRMFQNTLNLLSRQLIQQFLDELVWREKWGAIPSRAYDNIIIHLGDQTRVGVTDYLSTVYTFIASNPTKNWAYSYWRANFNSSPGGMMVSGSKLPGVAELAEIALEPYYYGTRKGMKSLQRSTPRPGAFRYGCRLCRAYESTRSDLNNHLVLHALNPKSVIRKKDNVNSLWSVCGFCMKPVKRLESHLKENHRQSHANTRRMCKICNSLRRDDSSLIYHMIKTHCELDMPYRCEVCEFRTSVYQAMLVHFEKCHVGDFCAQCPYCLKVVRLETASGDELPENQLYFVQHVQRHALCQDVKRCEKCLLCFTDISSLLQHQTVYHSSCASIEEVERYDLNPSFFVIMSAPIDDPLPPSSLSELPTGKFITISGSHPSLCCVECDGLVNSLHFAPSKTCEHCHYTTCCLEAFKLHSVAYHASPALLVPSRQSLFVGKPCITQPLFCTACSFSTSYGNRMAAHLTQCPESGEVATTDRLKAVAQRYRDSADSDHFALATKKRKELLPIEAQSP